MNRTRPALAALTALGLAAALPHAAHAQSSYDNTVYYYPANAAIGNLNGGAVIGFANGKDAFNHTHGTSPTVNITGTINYNTTNGGIYSGGVEAYNASTANLNGGTVFHSLFADDTATVNLNSGSINDGLVLAGSSTANINSGTVSGGLSLADSATVNISGGSITGVFSDGSVGDGLLTNSSSPLTITGGAISNGVSDTGSGLFRMTAGALSGGVTFGGSSPVSISGGTISGGLNAYGTGPVRVSGGQVSGGLADASTNAVTITGGTFGQAAGVNFTDASLAAFTFVGTGLTAVATGPDPNSGTDYRLAGVLQDGSSVTGDIVDVESGAAMFTLAAPGSSQAAPILPTSTSTAGGRTTFTFTRVPTNSWVDPVAATAFRFAMTGASLFTGISGFPTGFSGPFDVIAGGKDYGLFSSGQTLTFDGAGVSSFLVSGISPAVDGSDPTAFPLQVAFNTPLADFTMTAAPEPSPSAALTLGALGLSALALRARRRPAVS